MDQSKIKFSLTSGVLGNIVEHHDKALFTLLAPFIGPLFFATDSITALIYTYGLLYAGMLGKPLGALFFGYMGDVYGRARVLSITLIGMALSTFAMGCLPTYASLGVLAPILLAFLRVLQNFFAAGETSTSSVFVIEHSAPKFKPLAASFFELSTTLGILLVSCELSLLGAFDALAYGWRWLFWGGGALAFAIWIYRTKLIESNEFALSKEKPFASLKEVFADELKPLMAIILASGFSSATYVMSISFINSFLIMVTPFSFAELANLNTLLLFVDALLLPLFGFLTLKYEAEKIMQNSAKAVALLAIPMFSLLHYSSWAVIVIVRLILVILGVAFASCYHSWIQKLIVPKKRCTLLSLGSTSGSLLIEGPITVLSLWAFKQTEWAFIPGLFLAITAVGALVALRICRKESAEPIVIPA